MKGQIMFTLKIYLKSGAVLETEVKSRRVMNKIDEALKAGEKYFSYQNIYFITDEFAGMEYSKK